MKIVVGSMFVICNVVVMWKNKWVWYSSLGGSELASIVMVSYDAFGNLIS